MRHLGHSILLAAVLLGSVTAYAADNNQRLISVQGNGEVHVEPNTVTMQIAVETNALQANEAVKQNANQMSVVVDGLKKQLKPDDILSTSRYTLNPVYQYDRDTQKTSVSGYQVINYVLVTTKQLDQLGQLLDAAAASGANRVDSLQFNHDKISEYQQQALALAVADAQQTATILAKAAGVQLGQVMQIQPQLSNVQPMANMMMAKASGGQETTPIEPGKLTVSMGVSMEYAIQ